MNPRFLLVLALVFAWGPGASQAFARRGIPLPIVWGIGEDIAPCGELPDEIRSGIYNELGTSVKVGFLYDRFQLFFADVWTWNGRHVLYSGNEYWEPTPTQWSSMLGESPRTRYGTPVSYRAPLGLTILAAVVGLLFIKSRLFPPENKKLARLFRDPRYIEELDGLFAGKDGPTFATEYDETAFGSAVAMLHAKGVRTSEAETNLRKMADVVVATRNAQVDHALEAASHWSEKGDEDQCREILTQLLKALPKSDPRREQAAHALTELNESSLDAARDG